MFGFLVPSKPIAGWRRSYARVCQYQRKHFGLTALPFLSYESAFLYQVACDLGEIPHPDANAPKCCRLKRLPTSQLADEYVGTFCAAFGVVLAGIKVEDDVRDAGRIGNRLVQWKLRRQVKTARQILSGVTVQSSNFNLTDAIDATVSDHVRLETRQGVSLAEYVRPTGGGFARVFQSLPHASDRRRLSEIGEAVGQAIIAWDCAVDFERDRIKGEYNPLSSRAEVMTAFDLCLLQLAIVGWKLPSGSVSGQVVASVSAKVRRRKVDTQRGKVETVRRLERWGLTRQKGFVYAKLECCCCCEAICEGAECLSCGAEAATCGSGGCGEACFCLECAPIGVCPDSGSGKKPASPNAAGSESPYAHHVGTVTTTSGALNPAGYVIVDGERIPARTESAEFCDDEQMVEIIHADDFGVTVKVLE